MAADRRNKKHPCKARLLWIGGGRGRYYPAQVHLATMEVRFRQGQWAGAEEVCRKGISACRELGDEYHRGLFLNQLGNILSYRGVRQEALDTMKEAQLVLSRWPDDIIMISVLYNMGYACEHFGDLDGALENYRAGQELARRAGDLRSENRANGNIGIIYAMRGDYRTALDYFHRLLESSAGLDDLAGVALAHGNLGLAFLYSGDPEQAEVHLQQKQELSRKMGDRLGLCQSFGSLGDLLAARGDYPGALKSYALAREHSLAMNSLNMTVTADEKSGEILALMGNHLEAESILMGAVELADKMGSRLSLPSLWQKIGDCRLALGRPGSAEMAFHNSIAIGREKSQEPFYMGAHRGLAALELGRGKLDSAREHCKRFLELAQKYQDQEYVLDCRILEARIMAADAPGPAVEELLKIIDQPLPPPRRAEVLYWIWKLRQGPRDRLDALEALKQASLLAPTAENRERIDELDGPGPS
jgi:tetratricopeptide (TPR) repeat protein